LLALPADQRPATAAYATEDDPFTQPQVDKVKSLLEAKGVKTVYYKVYPSEPIDYTPLALQVANSKADAVILGTQVPDAIAFVKTFIAQHYNPKTLIETAGPDSAEAYSVGQVVEQAATKAGSIENQKLIDTLHTGTYQTIQGPMAFDAVGKPTGGVGVFVEQWQNGNAVFVYPTAVAAAPPEYPKHDWQ
jgi:branched-chain amino acid transport system substrate-binding protein